MQIALFGANAYSPPVTLSEPFCGEEHRLSKVLPSAADSGTLSASGRYASSRRLGRSPSGTRPGERIAKSVNRAV